MQRVVLCPKTKVGYSVFDNCFYHGCTQSLLQPLILTLVIFFTPTGIPTFPQTNKDICCNPKHPSFGCDYTGIPNQTFTNTKGSVADVIPFMHVGGWPGDPSWGTVSAVLPYTTWKSGGDASLVSSFYPLARSNVDFLLREGGDDVLIEFGYYGDWLSLENIPKPQVTATAQLMATSHVVEMAEYLQLQKDVQYYNQTLRTLKQLYHAKYWNESLKSYGHQQVANLMPLVLNIPPTALAQKQTADAFVASILAAGNATKSGLVGSSFVLQALLQVQRGDIALAMATRETFPSWGYMINQGPGTIWETWDDRFVLFSMLFFFSLLFFLSPQRTHHFIYWVLPPVQTATTTPCLPRPLGHIFSPLLVWTPPRGTFQCF